MANCQPLSVLLLTVGGSPDPLLTSVEELQPERVVFFASSLTRKLVDGPGKPNERRKPGVEPEKLESLVVLMQRQATHNPEEDVVVLEEIDDIQTCYLQMLDKVSQFKLQGHRKIHVDYTGGTKTMSAALAMVALDEGLEIHVTTGLRDNTRAVQRGQATKDVGVTDLRSHRIIQKEVERALEIFDYSAAQRHLHSLMRPRDLSKNLRDQVLFSRPVCECLAAWDIFDHTQALECIDGELFQRSEKVRSRLLMPLKRLVALRTWLHQIEDTRPLPKGTCGYELVDDLVLNAQRRAQVGRYDDAVGRYYRALEMLAQVRLRLRHNIHTGDVKPEQIPSDHQSKYLSPEGKPQPLGLTKAYNLLSDLGDPLIGTVYIQKEKELLNALKIRNYSLFAHGYDPIGKAQYQSFLNFIGGFLDQLLGELFGKTARLAQLPKSLAEIWDP